MHIVMTPVGSSGDVNPFVTIGRALKARGHTVTLIAPEIFAPVAAGAGL
ncbi:MAG: glycosyltransferase, partial [Gemmatimonadetes bacterium]|nr:glycosyltransferase [Gemmatimonadota bacterium]